MILRCLFIVTVLILLPLRSDSFRYLYEQSNVSPAPSPSNGIDLATDFENSCNRASRPRSCQLKNIAACLTDSQTGSREEIYLIVQNNGKNPLHVNITAFPANNTIKEIDLQTQQMEKIKISLDVESSSEITLKTRDGDCVIRSMAPSPENKYPKYPSYSTYITPLNGAYLGILVFFVGGSLICLKSKLRARHLDGVPYHELEMGNSKGLNVEEDEVENWDEDWDDEWGDEKENQKPNTFSGENGVKVKETNGLTKKLGKEWDD